MVERGKAAKKTAQLDFSTIWRKIRAYELKATKYPTCSHFEGYVSTDLNALDQSGIFFISYWANVASSCTCIDQFVSPLGRLMAMNSMPVERSWV